MDLTVADVYAGGGDGPSVIKFSRARYAQEKLRVKTMHFQIWTSIMNRDFPNPSLSPFLLRFSNEHQAAEINDAVAQATRVLFKNQMYVPTDPYKLLLHSLRRFEFKKCKSSALRTSDIKLHALIIFKIM